MNASERIEAEKNEEPVKWRCRFRVEKFAEDIGDRDLADFLAANSPYEVIDREGNLLMTAGANALWTALSAGFTPLFSNANAAIGVGDSTAAAAAGQINLQAATNAARQGQAAGYPAVSTNQVQFQAAFNGSAANFAWNEWGVFNSVGTGSPPTGGTMLNRAVPAGGLGTKVSGSTWTLTVTLSLS